MEGRDAAGGGEEGLAFGFGLIIPSCCHRDEGGVEEGGRAAGDYDAGR